MQTWLPEGPTSQVFLCCPEHTGSEAGALAGEEEVFPLSPHICTDPPSSAGCPDSLRLKKGTLGKTQFIESIKGTEFCFWFCSIKKIKLPGQDSSTVAPTFSPHLVVTVLPRRGVPQTRLANRALCFWHPP